MFTIKHFYDGGDNYHAYSAVWYFVDRLGLAVNSGMVHPRITMELSNGQELVIDVLNVVYVENSAGKTIDTVRPRSPRSLTGTA